MTTPTILLTNFYLLGLGVLPIGGKRTMWYYRDVYMDKRETVRFYEENHEIALGINCWDGHMSVYDGIYNFAGDKLPLWCHGSSL
jgi:hypothetical protein